MVNLRSGGTPDLAKEYVPTCRMNPETPEVQGSNAGLPTPATDRRTKLQGHSSPTRRSKRNRTTQISNTKTRGRDSASEETRMRLEIARLQHEVERITSGRATEASANDENVSADLADYLQRKGRTSAILKILNEFRDQVRPIRKPVVLTGSANYPMWKEEILLAARQSETDDILDEKQSGPNSDASPDM
ncbi:hypothetical protein ACJ73_06526 [Blastomyces percursus]|uniref:Uncharacterized protein n=1 Tax=Blastomyces percursus TaxID=1658174 RepID=A0A1J9Q0N8_9EURO|nr:hypothetical protein ACJ73_06526 [Blastomyces percursus]